LTLIAPSILSADFGRLAEDLHAVESAGADWIHVDVMDGHFVPNITIGPLVVDAVRRYSNLPLDVHLMIESPERYLEAFVDSGADRVTVHVETCPHLHRTLQQIRELGALPGVALNPATPVTALQEIVPYVDLILVMTVNPGFGGQAFIPTSLEKIDATRTLLQSNSRADVHVQVDGGVGEATASAMVEAGANVLVAGSAVYGHPGGAGEGVRVLRECISNQAESEQA
jgi:ribulose-phosphate 3-epimerase